VLFFILLDFQEIIEYTLDMNKTATIFKKLTNLEQQVQKLKVQAYFSLPKAQQSSGIYAQTEINDAVKLTRKQIWQTRYAKKT